MRVDTLRNHHPFAVWNAQDGSFIGCRSPGADYQPLTVRELLCTKMIAAPGTRCGGSHPFAREHDGCACEMLKIFVEPRYCTKHELVGFDGRCEIARGPRIGAAGSESLQPKVTSRKGIDTGSENIQLSNLPQSCDGI
jgi:hypothetical protein